MNTSSCPYTSANDERLKVGGTQDAGTVTCNIIIHLHKMFLISIPQWLETDFIDCLDEWEVSVTKRTDNDGVGKRKMCLSKETCLGLRITGKVNITCKQSVYTLLSYSLLQLNLLWRWRDTFSHKVCVTYLVRSSIKILLRAFLGSSECDLDTVTIPV